MYVLRLFLLRLIKDLQKLDGDFKSCYKQLSELKAELTLNGTDDATPESPCPHYD